MADTPEGYMNVEMMAQEAGVSTRAIYAAIRRKKLKAKKFGRDWFATKAAFNEYQNNSKGRIGRPRKP